MHKAISYYDFSQEEQSIAELIELIEKNGGAIGRAADTLLKKSSTTHTIALECTIAVIHSGKLDLETPRVGDLYDIASQEGLK
ncbi:MAG TPA: hypothetical protein VNM40_01255 [Candidatus Paceibacterota bacterium]|nr:hypothetical protein [Candidatus Paceibacterota bacterium]